MRMHMEGLKVIVPWITNSRISNILTNQFNREVSALITSRDEFRISRRVGRGSALGDA